MYAFASETPAMLELANVTGDLNSGPCCFLGMTYSLYGMTIISECSIPNEVQRILSNEKDSSPDKLSVAFAICQWIVAIGVVLGRWSPLAGRGNFQSDIAAQNVIYVQ